ncbi:dTDP-4-dehydrorhamnose 3,5-epimerase family protein [bacterium]|nr:dTDP-4-dehydrorhamnose 3,5-epimerase family protein [bacterium]
MKIHSTAIAGLNVAESKPHIDPRGSFMRLFCQSSLRCILGDRQILQINHSRTEVVGAIRGMHFQHSPFSEMKLVRCLRGRVWDIAVDLRMGSPTFLQWHAEELTPANHRVLIIPEGFAHGFQALESSSELLYLHTAFYNAEAEGGVRFDDPAIKISWPLPAADISPRDQSHELLTESFKGISP